MGNLAITDTDFSFEWDSTENSTPPGSADLPEQDILQNLQHWNEDFFFVFTLLRKDRPINIGDRVLLIPVKTNKYNLVAISTITIANDLDVTLVPIKINKDNIIAYSPFNAEVDDIVLLIPDSSQKDKQIVIKSKSVSCLVTAALQIRTTDFKYVFSCVEDIRPPAGS